MLRRSNQHNGLKRSEVIEPAINSLVQENHSISLTARLNLIRDSQQQQLASHSISSSLNR